MTPQEFKAWFEGFTEAFGNRVPTKAQWERVKTRVAEIDGKAVTERIYVDRYWRQYWNGPGWTYLAGNASGGLASSTANAVNHVQSLGNGVGAQNYTTNFCSTSAMNALGRADAAALAKKPA